MVRKVKLIMGLIVEEVLAHSDRIEYFSNNSINANYSIASDGKILDTKYITKSIIPIHKFCAIDKPTLYIAYSDEVEELLGNPIRTCIAETERARKREKDLACQAFDARNELNKYKTMKFWSRLKFLFKGKL